jgi:hypothetical protein
MKQQWNGAERGKTCSSATFSTTNPLLNALGANQRLWCEKPATNCLCYGAAKVNI